MLCSIYELLQGYRNESYHLEAVFINCALKVYKNCKKSAPTTIYFCLHFVNIPNSNFVKEYPMYHSLYFLLRWHSFSTIRL